VTPFGGQINTCSSKNIEKLVMNVKCAHHNIPIEPTILHEFGADTVHMPLGKSGYKYIINLHNKFSGWVKAKAL
jgi:hypothetical protein